MSEYKGIINELKKHATVFEYNPQKFWEGNTIDSIFKAAQELDEKNRKRKPDYIITVGEAKTANLFTLQWICKNYQAMCGLETKRILDQREIIINLKK